MVRAKRAHSTKSKAGRAINADERLARDGACSRSAIRRRIQLIAQERRLRPAAVAKAMTCGTNNVVEFCERHDVSCDWLVCGDLKGLLATVERRRMSALRLKRA